MELHDMLHNFVHFFDVFDIIDSEHEQNRRSRYQDHSRQPIVPIPNKTRSPSLSATEITVIIVLVSGIVAGIICIFTARSVVKRQIISNYQLPKNCLLRIICGILILLFWMTIRLVFFVPIVLERIILVAIAATTNYKGCRRNGSPYGPFAWTDGKLRHGIAHGLAWLFRGCRRAPHREQAMALQPLRRIRPSPPDGVHYEPRPSPPAYGSHVGDSLVTPPPPTYKAIAGEDERTMLV